MQKEVFMGKSQLIGSLFLLGSLLVSSAWGQNCSKDLSTLSDQTVMALAQTQKLGLCAASLTDFKDENHFDIIIWSLHENGVWAWKAPIGARKLTVEKTAALLREFAASGICYNDAPSSIRELSKSRTPLR